jgi:protein transport protein SEC61 subunit beta
MLKLYTDESPGLRVDPVVVLVLSLGFIFSVVGLHGKNGLNIPDIISMDI